MDTALLKPSEAAHELRVSRATIYRLINAKEIQAVHVGQRRATRIERTALADYIARSRRAPEQVAS